MSGDHSTGHELILNACESVLQIVLTDNEEPICFAEWHSPKRATELLAPQLEAMFKSAGIKAQDLRRVGCVAGPGSFTGIRLVLATAAALRRCSRALLASLDYLQALATSAIMRRGLLYGSRVIVVTRARRDLVHFQEFISYGPVIPAAPLTPAMLISPTEALARMAERPCLVCGSGLARHTDIFAMPVTGHGPLGAPEATLLPELVNPDLPALLILSRHGEFFGKDVDPKYIRDCDAMENLAAKEGGEGDLARAREMMTAMPDT